MKTHAYGLALIGSLCLLAAAASAQTPSGLDGTYAFVSSKQVNRSYTARGGQMFVCPELNAGPLTIAQGRASYTTDTGHQLAGTVGPQGQLSLGSVQSPSSGGGYRPVETNVTGSVAANGYARARQIGNSCSYDFIWQKEAK